jgi:hypothetical protein
VKTSHEGLPDVAGAADAFDAVEDAAEGLRALVPVLCDALTNAVDVADTAADSVPKLVLSSINKDTTLRKVVRLYKRAYPQPTASAHGVTLAPESEGTKLQDWWLTRNSSPAGAEAMLGTGDAAEAARGFAGTLDALCRRLKLPDRTSLLPCVSQLLLCPLLFRSPSTCYRRFTLVSFPCVPGKPEHPGVTRLKDGDLSEASKASVR